MNSGLSYTTSTVHQNPFGGVNQWGTLVVRPTFTPSSYILLQVVTSTPIYTMEVNNSFGRIEKFREYHFFEGVEGNFFNCGL
jgi:hypothetical protein